MKITRYYNDLENYLAPGKALILYGPRQVGKTTLLQDFLKSTPLRTRLDTGDNISLQHLLGGQNKDRILEYCEGYQLIAIDEAQKVPKIGVALKIIVDHLPKTFVIATGSSSFTLAGEVGEPLTGRKITLTLFPLSQLELRSLYNTQELKQHLAEWLVFGCYPEVLTAPTQAKRLRALQELADSYLLKDILELERVKSSKKVLDLLRLLAFQVGNEVSLNELATQLGIDGKTVARYLDLLEKTFIIQNIRGFNRNLRKEISQKSKYYFYDNGIRNAVIANFNTIELRNDLGALWENFVVMERLKYRAYRNIPGNSYFWRTWDQKEIDLVEEREGRLFGYEFKWSQKKSSDHPPKDWTTAYPDATYNVITPENYLPFVTQ